MTVKYLDAKRIQGVASDKATLLSPGLAHNCEEGVNCDTGGVNPDTNDRRKYGYKLGASASIIGEISS